MGRKKRDVPMKRINYFLRVDQIDRIEAICQITGQDRSEVIRLAIDAYLAKAERKMRRSLDRIS